MISKKFHIILFSTASSPLYLSCGPEGWSPKPFPTLEPTTTTVATTTELTTLPMTTEEIVTKYKPTKETPRLPTVVTPEDDDRNRFGDGYSNTFYTCNI